MNIINKVKTKHIINTIGHEEFINAFLNSSNDPLLALEGVKMFNNALSNIIKEEGTTNIIVHSVKFKSTPLTIKGKIIIDYSIGDYHAE